MGVCGSVSQEAANLAQASVYFGVDYFYLVLNESFYFHGAENARAVANKWRLGQIHGPNDNNKQTEQLFLIICLFTYSIGL